jgi:hypothetical protein
MTDTLNNTLTEGDIKQTVLYAQGRPHNMTFSRACYVVARMTGDKTPEQVEAICSNADALIAEAMRVPQMQQMIHPNKGEIIIF